MTQTDKQREAISKASNEYPSDPPCPYTPSVAHDYVIKQHEAFQRWAMLDGFSVIQDGEGNYECRSCQDCWQAWQAAIAHNKEKLREVRDAADNNQIQVGWYMQGGWQETEFYGGFEHSPFTLHRVTNILSDVTGKQMYVMVDDEDELIPIEGNNFYKSLPDGLKQGDMVALFEGGSL